MQKLIRGIAVTTVVAGAVLMWGQTAPATAPTAPAQAAAPAAAAPSLTADQVVDKYLDAIGGKEAIGQVKSLSMTTSAQVMGTDAPGTIVVVDGVGYRSDTTFNDAKITTAFTAKNGWQVNAMAGMNDPTPLPDDQYNAGKDQIFVGGQLYDYAAKGSKLELASSDKDTYTLKLTTKDGLDTTYVIDGATFLLKSSTRKGKMQDQDVDITTSYSDYQKVDGGYMVPRTLLVDLGGQFQIPITVTKVEVNKTIDPTVFDMPTTPKT